MRTSAKQRSRPIMKEMCATCPFKPGSKLASLESGISESAKTNGRICHSTHKHSVIYGNNPPIDEPHICRGARDQQLKMCFERGLIREPTDEAWQETCDLLGIVRDAIPES